MKQFALIVDGRVVEVIEEFQLIGEGDDAVNVPLSERYHPDFIALLTEYDPNNPPAEPAQPELPVPSVLTMRQARLALLTAGVLDDVAPAIAALPEAERRVAEIEWEYAATVERHAPLVQLLASNLGLDVDEMFTAGAKL